MLALSAAGCATARQTSPPRTATEQLLISTAADHAADELKFPIAPGAKVFVDAQFVEGIDVKYTIGTVRDRLLKQGAALADKRENADVVVEIRSGGQSIDESSFLLGIPSFDIPVPLTGTVKTPELALFKHAKQQGISKVAVTAYGQKDGALRFSSGPDYGFSHRTQWTVLLLVSWTRDDLIPKDKR